MRPDMRPEPRWWMTCLGFVLHQVSPAEEYLASLLAMEVLVWNGDGIDECCVADPPNLRRIQARVHDISLGFMKI